MKTLIKSLAFALTFGFATSVATVSHANPITRPANVASYKTGVYSSVDGKLNIALDKTVGGSVNITLKDANGKTLYVERLGKKATTSRIRLNLDELKDGTYQVEITNGVETTTHNVVLSTPQSSSPTRVVALN